MHSTLSTVQSGTTFLSLNFPSIHSKHPSATNPAKAITAERGYALEFICHESEYVGNEVEVTVVPVVTDDKGLVVTATLITEEGVVVEAMTVVAGDDPTVIALLELEDEATVEELLVLIDVLALLEEVTIVVGNGAEEDKEERTKIPSKVAPIKNAI